MAAARGGGGVGSAGDYQSAAGEHREEGRDFVCVRTGERADYFGAAFAGAASGTADQRRDAQARGDSSSVERRQAAVEERARRHSGDRAKDGAKIAERV